MPISSILIILAAVALSLARLFVPTVPHSWPMVFVAFAHIYVGALLTLLVRRPRWLLGWLCLGLPTALELALFLVHEA